MSTHRNLMTVCFAAVFALGLAACSSSKDDPAPPGDDMTMDGDADTDTTIDPGPSDLDETQMAAKAAADAAKMASDAADASADAAEAATMNLVGIQTNKDATAAKMSAEAARMHANTAMAEYMKAKAAAEAAAAATDVRAAGKAERDAEAAKMAAEKAQMDAEMAAAIEEAMGLKIDGKTKSVGDKSITVDGIKRRAGTGGVNTGLLDMTIMQKEHGAVTAQAFSAATTPDTPYKQAVVARDIDIGVQYDDPDGDMARLTLVHSYAGSTKVKVFAHAEVEQTGTPANRSGTKKGSISSDPTATATTNDVSLKSEGMFYQVGTGEAGFGGDSAAAAAHSLAKDTKAMQVYSFVSTEDDPSTTDVDETARTYLVRQSMNAVTDATGKTTTTYLYRSVDIDAPLSSAPATGTSETAATLMPVMADLPVPMPYAHLHYGLWNSLKDVEGDNNSLADLGIGFVTATADGMGMTGDDMLSAGNATYNGNWVASVRASKENGGAITHQSGESMVTANFSTNAVEVGLDGLAKLEGTIDGNAFMGTKVSGVTGGDAGLTGSADGKMFTGSFSGGFFGPKAVEAGGIFDYTSASMAAGEFRGAFGGVKQPN